MRSIQISISYSVWLHEFGRYPYSGIRIIVKEVISKRRFIVRRSDMADLSAVARAGAEASIDVIAGDLSWNWLRSC